jgi:hypothetical protein
VNNRCFRCSLKELSSRCLFDFEGSRSETIAGGFVEGSSGGGSIDTILGNLAVGVVAVIESLERDQVLLSICASTGSELKVDLV